MLNLEQLNLQDLIIMCRLNVLCFINNSKYLMNGLTKIDGIFLSRYF